MRWIALGALAGCGWSEHRFEVDGIGLLCDEAAACAGTYDAAACVDELRLSDRSTCDYDGREARSCAKELKEPVCAHHEQTGLSWLDVPEACHAAYTCAWIELEPLDDADELP